MRTATDDRIRQEDGCGGTWTLLRARARHVPVARILALRSHSHGTAPRAPRRLHQYAPSELRGVMVEMQRVFSIIVPTPRDVIDFMLINVKAMYIEP